MNRIQNQSLTFGALLIVLLAIAGNAQALSLVPTLKAPSLTPTIKVYPTPVVVPVLPQVAKPLSVNFDIESSLQLASLKKDHEDKTIFNPPPPPPPVRMASILKKIKEHIERPYIPKDRSIKDAPGAVRG